MSRGKLTRNLEQFVGILVEHPKPKNKIARGFEKAAALAVTRLTALRQARGIYRAIKGNDTQPKL